MVYPDDSTANLNAANAAMGGGELDKAERYLAKAGYSQEAAYARGVLAALRQQYTQAKTLFSDAASMNSGTPVGQEASKACAEMDEFIY